MPLVIFPDGARLHTPTLSELAERVGLKMRATEAMSCKDEDVYVVGGANSARQAAMHFSKYARRVVMLVRGPSLSATMSQYLIDQIKATPNIQIEFNSSVVEAHGEERLEAISVYCGESNETNIAPANSLFILIGAMPRDCRI